MPLLVCPACERQRIIQKLEKIDYICSNCGAHKALKIRRKGLWTSWADKAGVIKIEAMRGTYAGLKRIAEFNKYNPKWPLPKFKSIFHIWPPYEISEVPPAPPSKALLRWIAKSNEAWRKAKREEEKKMAPETVLRLPEPDQEVLSGTLSQGEAYTPSFMTAEDWKIKL